MKTLKIFFVALVAVTLVISPVYGARNENNNGRGNSSENNNGQGNSSANTNSQGNGSVNNSSRGNSSANNSSQGNGSVNNNSRGNSSANNNSRGNSSVNNNSRGNGSAARAQGNVSSPKSTAKSNNAQGAKSASSSDRRRNNIEKSKAQANERANRPDKEKNGKSVGHSELRADNSKKADRDQRADHRKAKEDRIKKLIASLEKARWSQNPHDERGQGNMGKPKMLDPFGHDKDSDRKELYGNNGRPIREKEKEEEVVVDVAEVTTVDFQVIDGYLSELQVWFDWMAQYYPADSWILQYYQEEIDNYSLPYDKVSVIDTGEHIDYVLSVPEEFAGETLLVTTRLVSVSDYEDWFDSYYVDIDFDTGAGEFRSQTELAGTHLQIAVGDILVEETQEIVMSEDGTYSVSYDPPIELVGDLYGYGLEGGYLAELSVTVTNPDTGASYTTTYDRQINLYRCPYGKITNKANGQPVAGAKITVHFEDGSIVPLDKAANPTATNPQITDAMGRYGVKLLTNRKYYMTAKAEGYKPYKSEIFTEKWHVLREDIKLVPEEDKVAFNQ